MALEAMGLFGGAILGCMTFVASYRLMKYYLRRGGYREAARVSIYFFMTNSHSFGKAREGDGCIVKWPHPKNATLASLKWGAMLTKYCRCCEEEAWRIGRKGT